MLRVPHLFDQAVAFTDDVLAFALTCLILELDHGASEGVVEIGQPHLTALILRPDLHLLPERKHGFPELLLVGLFGRRTVVFLH